MKRYKGWIWLAILLIVGAVVAVAMFSGSSSSGSSSSGSSSSGSSSSGSSWTDSWWDYTPFGFLQNAGEAGGAAASDWLFGSEDGT